MQSISPNIFVKNINETINFYEQLEFTLTLRVPEEVTLKCQGEIMSWKIEIDSVAYAGQGSDFSEEARQAIITADNTQAIRLSCIIIDRAGIQRHRKVEFKVG